MKTALVVIFTSLIIIIAVAMLNFASYKDNQPIKEKSKSIK
jgi:hypothetical protein